MTTSYGGGTEVFTNGSGHMTRMNTMPVYGKTLQKSLEPKGQWPWDLVCSIVGVGLIKFVQIMILGWPWPTLWQGQICLLMF